MEYVVSSSAANDDDVELTPLGIYESVSTGLTRAVMEHFDVKGAWGNFAVCLYIPRTTYLEYGATVPKKTWKDPANVVVYVLSALALGVFFKYPSCFLM